MANKITKSFKVDDKLWEMFTITVAATTNNNYSDVLESIINDYIIKSKVDVNEKIKNWWNQ